METKHPHRPTRETLVIAGLLATALALTACGGGSDKAGGDKLANGDTKNISIGVPSGWDEGIATSAVFTHILEDEGYTVDAKTADVAVIYTGLSKGDFNVFLDAWLPVTHKDYVAKYKDSITDLGTWYEGATLNIAVNEDSPAKTIEDLKTMGGEYGNKLIGIEPGAGLTAQTKQAIKDYGLDDIDLRTSSTPAMLAELKGAAAKKQNIAVTLWHPHWAYAAYPLRDLEDPKGSMGKGESLHSYGDKDFTSEYPNVTKLLAAFTMSDEKLAELEKDINDAGNDADKGSANWLEDNPDFVAELKKAAGVE